MSTGLIKYFFLAIPLTITVTQLAGCGDAALQFDEPPKVATSLRPASVAVFDSDGNRLTAVGLQNLGIIFQPTYGFRKVQKRFIVKNEGEVALSFASLDIPEGLKIVETLPDSLAAGDSIGITVEVDTLKLGFKSVAITVNTTDEKYPKIVLPFEYRVMRVCPADFLINGVRDGFVDFNDLVILAQHYNMACEFAGCGGDGDASQSIDFADLVLLAQTYNGYCPSEFSIFKDTLRTQPISPSGDPINLGSASLGSTEPGVILTVQNDGGLPLNITNISIPPGFHLIKAASGPLARHATDTIVIGLETANLGTKLGKIKITTNDAFYPTFEFQVTGTVTEQVPIP